MTPLSHNFPPPTLHAPFLHSPPSVDLPVPTDLHIEVRILLGKHLKLRLYVNMSGILEGEVNETIQISERNKETLDSHNKGRRYLSENHSSYKGVKSEKSRAPHTR